MFLRLDEKAEAPWERRSGVLLFRFPDDATELALYLTRRDGRGDAPSSWWTLNVYVSSASDSRPGASPGIVENGLWKRGRGAGTAGGVVGEELVEEGGGGRTGVAGGGILILSSSILLAVVMI